MLSYFIMFIRDFDHAPASSSLALALDAYLGLKTFNYISS